MLGKHKDRHQERGLKPTLRYPDPRSTASKFPEAAAAETAIKTRPQAVEAHCPMRILPLPIVTSTMW